MPYSFEDTSCDLLCGLGNDEVQKLLVGHWGVAVGRHQRDEELALLVGQVSEGLSGKVQLEETVEGLGVEAGTGLHPLVAFAAH